jgi:hypothetical protein
LQFSNRQSQSQIVPLDKYFLKEQSGDASIVLGPQNKLNKISLSFGLESTEKTDLNWFHQRLTVRESGRIASWTVFDGSILESLPG